jgi:hypothetical protein
VEIVEFISREDDIREGITTGGEFIFPGDRGKPFRRVG